jgi:RimJ/RimL family protein N-acetyltransferase
VDVIVSEDELVIRPMLDEADEYERFARWRNEPHVREWWDPDDPPMTSDEARQEYGPLVRGEDPMTACVIEFEGRAAGYVQFHPWEPFVDDAVEMGFSSDVEGAWGLDVFIGEPDLVDRGIGSAAVDLLCRYMVEERGASRVMLVAAAENGRALRAYEKVGFVRTERVLDTDTRDGRRVESWLLVRSS